MPATEDLVWEMLGTFGRDPTQNLGVIQPRNAPVTLEKIAINAVMAGCRPEHFPVVVAAVRAILQPVFNVAGCQATTGGAAPVIIVNGPLATQLSINGDAGCFGPGYRANAAIGRALRLVIRNLAGLIPGEMDRATLATRGRYSFCFAENEPAALGAAPRGVGLCGQCEHRHPDCCPGGPSGDGNDGATGREILQTLVESIKTVGFANYYQIGTGAQLTLVLCPEHAAEMAAAGLTKADVRAYIFQEARMPMRRLKGIAHYGNRNCQAWIDENDPATSWMCGALCRRHCGRCRRRRWPAFRLAGRVGGHQGRHGGDHDAGLVLHSAA